MVGSRFAGPPRDMRPHRWFGNRLLTPGPPLVRRRGGGPHRRPAGYRALSPAAAADAEIIHDFNYAQVLTLDLLAKGFRYAEVPITYRFREHGKSFIRLGPYLRHVVPAVRRELRSKAAASSAIPVADAAMGPCAGAGGRRTPRSACSTGIPRARASCTLSTGGC